MMTTLVRLRVRTVHTSRRYRTVWLKYPAEMLHGRRSADLARTVRRDARAYLAYHNPNCGPGETWTVLEIATF